jgi:hypothetical protein
MFAIWNPQPFDTTLQLIDRIFFVPASRQHVFQTWSYAFLSQSKLLGHPEETADVSHDIMFLCSVGNVLVPRKHTTDVTVISSQRSHFSQFYQIQRSHM